MIRVTVELLPWGDPSRRQLLHRIDIWNDLSGTTSSGSYKATISFKGQAERVWKSVQITGFPRRRLGAHDLLYRVLRAALSERNPQ